MPQQSEAPRVALILAGGGARRLGGVDKGAIKLAGRRLFDLVLERLSPQVDQILISGTEDYGSGRPLIADRDDGPRGPAAGLWSTLRWIEESVPDAEAFFSVPVDGPFLPPDLVARLEQQRFSAIACDANGLHPTFGYWRMDALRAALSIAPRHYGYPMRVLADSVHAERILFDDPGAFENINTPEDLQRAEKRLRP